MLELKNVDDILTQVERKVSANRGKLAGALVNRDLVIPVPSDAPQDLVKKLGAFNKAAATWKKRDAALADVPPAMVRMLSDGDVTAATLAETAQAFQRELYDVAQLRVTLLLDRKELLDELTPVLELRQAALEADLEKVKAATRKKLGRAGAGVEAEEAFIRGNAEAAEITFAQRVARTPAIREAVTQVEQAAADLASNSRLIAAIDADVLTVGQRLIGVWRDLAGL